MAKPQDLQLTDWIPCTTPPVRVGVYEVMQPSENGPFYAYWDGERFSFRSSSDADHAYEKRGYGTLYGPPEKWRGVRRWVLEIETDLGKRYLIDTNEIPTVGYLENCLSYDTQWNAKRVAMRFPGLGLKAVRL